MQVFGDGGQGVRDNRRASGAVHLEANFEDPNATLTDSPNDGFVRMNDGVDQPDRGIETATEDPTMGFYTQVDLPFYYDLAEKFAIDDRYFASVIGPTLPNRFYLLATTSFGHVSTGDLNYLSPDGLKPIRGTILDLLDSRGITWTDCYEFSPQAGPFRPPSGTTDPHFRSVEVFLTVAAGFSGAAPLPQVSFLDARYDQHPPASEQPGAGAACNASVPDAESLCPALAQNPGGPLRDQYASALEDLFDFDNAPSLDTPVIEAQLPVIDCTPAGY